MANLFHLADINGPALEAQVAALYDGRAESQAASLSRFLAFIAAEGATSINMRPSRAEGFLTRGRCTTVHEHATAVCGPGDDSHDVLSDALGPWCTKRLAFDRHFNGELFVYGALNAGGLGPRQYGYYCFLFTDGSQSEGALRVYLPYDSLCAYVTADGEIAESTLSTALGDTAHRGHVALMKHVDDLTDPGWDRVICHDDVYIEVIFDCSPSPMHVAEIRLPEVDYVRLYELAFDLFQDDYSPDQLLEAEVFRQLTAYAHSHSLSIRPVP